ncbi:MAG: ribosomal RNA small subunit methyltransferase A [Myxococcales bacterium]|nr:ribosomal RNA small subunit methyltransferase A [Myxococcales bacterium]
MLLPTSLSEEPSFAIGGKLEALSPSGSDVLDARELLRRYGLAAKKSWGQNFLVDERSYAAIVRACGLTPEEVAVEVGAGLGTLTSRLLATGAQVVAVERERDMCEVLRRELDGRPGFVLREENALHLDLPLLASQYGRKLTLVGNLPYQIASPLIFQFLAARSSLRQIVIMIQREMADRLLAPPGSRDSNALGVQVQMVCATRRVCQVGRGAFLPPPRVDSSVVMLTPLPGTAVPLRDLDVFHQVVRAAFGQRRKTLRNALSAVFSDEQMASLSHCGVDLSRRGESLLLSEFALLSDALSVLKSQPVKD